MAMGTTTPTTPTWRKTTLYDINSSPVLEEEIGEEGGILK